MRVLLLLLLALPTVVAASCATAETDPAARGRSQVETGLLGAVTFQGEEHAYSVAERMAYYDVPGLSFALINDGELEWAAGYGVKDAGSREPVTTETLFQAASIAKAGVAVAAIRMRDAGLIDLDADIQTFLREFTVPEGAQTESNPVTFRNLLSHTAGITPGGYLGYERGEPYPTDLQIVRGLPPANSPRALVTTAPGTAVLYSGGGYTLVELALQDLTGESMEDVMDEWLLSPVGMDHSTYAQPLPPELEDQAALGHSADGSVVSGGWRVHPEQAAAGLWSTPSDLARLAMEVRKAYQEGSELLKRSSAVELLTEQLQGEGIGLVLRGHGEEFAFSHAGGNVGYRAFMVMHPASGDGAVFMTNSDRGMEVGMEMLRAASAVHDWPDYKPISVRRVDLERAALALLVGTYDFGDGIQVVIDLEGSADQLSITFPNGDRYALVPTAALSFVNPETGVTVDFDGPADRRHVIVYGDTGVRVRQ